MTDATYNKLLKRLETDPKISNGEPCIRGTRIHIATILDSLAEGLSPAEIIEHFPSLTDQDIRAAIAYAAELSRTVSAACATSSQSFTTMWIRFLMKSSRGPVIRKY